MFAQTISPSFWNAPNGSTALWIAIAAATLAGFAFMGALMAAPPRVRKPVVAAFTFFAGLYWVLFYLWPKPVNRLPGDLERNVVEKVAFWLEDANTVISSTSNVLTAFLLGLGIYSLLRIHGQRVFKGHKDAFFSGVLLVSIFVMAGVGYWEWILAQNPDVTMVAVDDGWGPARIKDLLFDGLLQEMDAGMFSIIAFFVLSAAYRAFRIRSVEATLMLATAFIVMLGLMGAVEYAWNGGIDSLKGTTDPTFADNFKLTEIVKWISGTLQTPSLRGIDFGIGIGALAMGLRLWLSLEKTAVSS